jgi:RNA polymerase-binding transcription factor DksA
MMAEKNLMRLKELLLRQRMEIFQRKQRLESNWDELSEREIEMEEVAQKAALAEIYEQLDEQEQEEIGTIDLALDKIDTDTYGICEGCRKAISPERLALLPATPYCIACSLREGKGRKVPPASI